jgi:hypothetical protein
LTAQRGWFLAYHESNEVVSSFRRPVCAAFMNTNRSTGLDGDRFSMTSRMYGVRDVRYLPASPAALRDRIR